MQHFDVIIAGGGASGMCLALSLLQRTDLQIAIVEAHPFDAKAQHPGFDARSVALAAKSCELLREYGLTKLDTHFCDIAHIHVSDQGHVGQCQLHAADYHLKRLGAVVEMHHLGQSLFARLKQIGKSRLTWFCPDQINALTNQQDKIEITLESGQSLSAKLLVVAEGAQSPTRSLLNIGHQSQAYHQAAIIANVSTSEAHQHRAYERFTAGGPLAMLPLPDDKTQQVLNRCSLVWTVPLEQQQKMMAMSDTEFLAALQQAFGYRLGRLQKVGERVSYPLALIEADRFIAHRAVLVGNASQSLHPIAGQGLNLGLRDIEQLTSLLRKAEKNHQDIGDVSLLHHYQQSRLGDKRKVIQFTDGLVSLFSNQYRPLVAGRNLALSAMNVLPAVKRQLAMQAMGFTGHMDASEQPANFQDMTDAII